MEETRYNAKIVWNTTKRLYEVIALETIYPGQEIFIPYGPEYWFYRAPPHMWQEVHNQYPTAIFPDFIDLSQDSPPPSPEPPVHHQAPTLPVLPTQQAPWHESASPSAQAPISHSNVTASHQQRGTAPVQRVLDGRNQRLTFRPIAPTSSHQPFQTSSTSLPQPTPTTFTIDNLVQFSSTSDIFQYPASPTSQSVSPLSQPPSSPPFDIDHHLETDPRLSAINFGPSSAALRLQPGSAVPNTVLPRRHQASQHQSHCANARHADRTRGKPRNTRASYAHRHSHNDPYLVYDHSFHCFKSRNEVHPTKRKPSCQRPSKALLDLHRRCNAAISRLLATAPPGELPSEILNLDLDGGELTWVSASTGPNVLKWLLEKDKEHRRLMKRDDATLIPTHFIPEDRRKDVTYSSMQVREKLDGITKEILRRVRLCLGGDKINYPGNRTANTAALETVKIGLLSAISKGESWLNLDIVDFYLGTPLERTEYMSIPVSQLSDAIIAEFDLAPFINNGKVYFAVVKAIYGLPQAGFLAQQRLIQHLAEAGYVQDPHVPLLFKHETRNVTFTLVVDDFGVKYKNKSDVEHLIASLSQHYKIKVDWECTTYLGISLKWDRSKGAINLSMPKVIPRLLEQNKDLLTGHGAQSPMIYVPPNIGETVQYVHDYTSPPLAPAMVTRVQSIIGCTLYYGRVIDCTILPAVNFLASEQSRPTEQLLASVKRLLAYLSAYPCNELVLRACDMVYYIQSDASYHSRRHARSVAGGIHYMGNHNCPFHINGPFFCMSTIISVVVASAAEAEYAAIFMNAQVAEVHRTVLRAYGHPQSATTIFSDNTTAIGISHKTVKLKRAKAMDMRFHWVQDRVAQGHFNIVFRDGSNNLADFFTKALPVHKHQEAMHLLVHSPNRKPGHRRRSPASKL